MDKEKKLNVAVAMSGGVDSSVSATLLKEAGFDVIGIFMKLNNNSSNASKRASLVAKKLGIPFRILDLRKEFNKKVIDYFINEYKAGRTPNPCVVCNYEIKFGLLIEKALKIGAKYIATGHYARISNDKLLKGIDKNKDQSYFLWKLSQKQLSRVLFPVGGYKKSAVRALAKKFDLPTAETPESQEVCFISDSTNEFLKRYIKSRPGKIVLGKKIIGGHIGLWFYTIGQRKGIGLSGGPFYVIDKDMKKNALIVSKDKKDLLKKELIAKDVNWISNVKLPLKVEAKIRYRHKSAKAVITNKFKVIFDKPQRAITPGQSVVFYNKEELLGGGIIV
ncbi:MAG: tRNA 2-thiouridine(34) synthase MnmA [Candidatus Nealsonbacteria bacterium]|nr:tRNA 2-thiouridine(34) synthase MnmA [Candidatus Nealsonbacteria bacterium]